MEHNRIQESHNREVGIRHIVSVIAGDNGKPLDFLQGRLAAAPERIRIGNALATRLKSDDAGEEPLIQEREIFKRPRSLCSVGYILRTARVRFRLNQHSPLVRSPYTRKPEFARI